jgi:2,4-dienoyl-CoA reductase-like NADH-dependent reductase (Old Yellow Enzyme family)/thioredoxin reductase
MREFKTLFSPMKVGTHTYKNRIVAAPIYCGPFINVPGLNLVLDYAMKSRADGGCAQVTLGETPVDFVGASREPFPPIDYTDFNDPAMPKFKELVAYIQSKGAKCMIELSHCGESVVAIPGVEFGMGPMGYTREDGMVIYAMDEEKMRTVADHFVSAAKFMKEAGMDGVMIHVGHGWLLHQFLSSRTNRRSDEYGGALENRARFPLMVLKAVRDAMGRDFILEIRASGEENEENGMGIEETVAFCGMAEPYVDLIHVSAGTYRNSILGGGFSSLFKEHGLNAWMSEAVKKAVNVPVVVVGGINSPAFAEDLISRGKCDFVALGRQLIADPEFANKAESGRESDINACMRCFRCFPGDLEGVDLRDLPNLFGCTANPAAFFHNFDLLNSRPTGSRNVLVIGGGAAGMQAAITAHDRGHSVTLVEKTEKLGGILFFTDTDIHKEDLRNYRDLLIRRVKERDIEVVLNKEFMPADIKDFNADAVIPAIGSSPLTPSIKGIENAMHALETYRDIDKVGKKVVVVGGGLVGCETGLNLAERGREVTIVEMAGAVAVDAYPPHRIALLDKMDGFVTVKVDTKCTEIKPNGIISVDASGNEIFIKADSVVYALGMQAKRTETEALRAAAEGARIFEIGDCVRAAKVFDAVREGYVAGLSVL